MNRTKQRIIDASLDLFNEQGERHVTTNHIAAHLGISPGNLYYHFRNKEEIIRAIFEQYAQHWRQSLESGMGRGDTIENMQHLLDALFEGLWHFRFFYANLPVLLGRDPALRSNYQALQKDLDQQMTDLFAELNRVGILSVPEEQLDELVKTVHMVVICWIGFQHSVSPDATITRQIIYEGIGKVLFLISPWVTEAARDDVDGLAQIYRDRLTEEQSQTNPV